MYRMCISFPLLIKSIPFFCKTFCIFDNLKITRYSTKKKDMKYFRNLNAQLDLLYISNVFKTIITAFIFQDACCNKVSHT
jgi:hypothetical protein